MFPKATLDPTNQQTTEPEGPRLYLIGRPAFDIEAFLSFLASSGETWQATDKASGPEHIVEVAGRVCYMSFGSRQFTRTNQRYIANLIEQGHESVLEHVNWTFVLEGVSRAFSHQFVRHRVGFAFSQMSQQYHEESGATFVEPSSIKKYPELASLWHDVVEAARSAYDTIVTTLEREKLLNHSVDEAREALRLVRAAARSVLPNATETKLVFTANARALRHFLAVRGSIIGDEEMRLVSSLLFECLKTEVPSLFQDFDSEILQDGLPIVYQPARRESNGDT